MKVKALEKLHYDLEIKMPGEVFELHDVHTTVNGEKKVISAEDQFSERSMLSLEDAPAAAKKPVARKHGAPKGDRVVVGKSNPNTGDNVKSKEDLKNAHGGEQEADGEGDDEGADVL